MIYLNKTINAFLDLCISIILTESFYRVLISYLNVRRLSQNLSSG